MTNVPAAHGEGRKGLFVGQAGGIGQRCARARGPRGRKGAPAGAAGSRGALHPHRRCPALPPHALRPPRTICPSAPLGPRAARGRETSHDRLLTSGPTAAATACSCSQQERAMCQLAGGEQAAEQRSSISFGHIDPSSDGGRRRPGIVKTHHGTSPPWSLRPDPTRSTNPHWIILEGPGVSSGSCHRRQGAACDMKGKGESGGDCNASSTAGRVWGAGGRAP